MMPFPRAPEPVGARLIRRTSVLSSPAGKGVVRPSRADPRVLSSFPCPPTSNPPTSP
jgi:hypothetical protein